MWHRLAVNLEDAGFELRDTVMWLYGSGFPKSHNISKALDKVAGARREVVGRVENAIGFTDYAEAVGGSAGFKAEYNITAPATDAAKLWEGWGTALKPAWEPALLVQKPLAGTFANNALTHGCGGLNIDGCRVGYINADDKAAAAAAAMRSSADQNAGRTAYGSFNNGAASIAPYIEKQALGRFPANLILDEEAGQALDEQSGNRPAGSFPAVRGTSHIGFASGQETEGGARKMTDKGGASRFFYCAKASTKERNAGLGNKNNHPTLKPIALTTYLAKLLLVPARADCQPRRILVPFSGAGSEMIGCLLAGWDEVWGIELNGDYVKIAEARIKHHVPEAAPLDCPDLGDAA